MSLPKIKTRTEKYDSPQNTQILQSPTSGAAKHPHLPSKGADTGQSHTMQDTPDNSFFKLGRQAPGTVLCYSRTNSCFSVITLLFLYIMELPDSLSIRNFQMENDVFVKYFATFVFVLKTYTQAHPLGCVISVGQYKSRNEEH